MASDPRVPAATLKQPHNKLLQLNSSCNSPLTLSRTTRLFATVYLPIPSKMPTHTEQSKSWLPSAPTTMTLREAATTFECPPADLV